MHFFLFILKCKNLVLIIFKFTKVGIFNISTTEVSTQYCVVCNKREADNNLFWSCYVYRLQPFIKGLKTKNQESFLPRKFYLKSISLTDVFFKKRVDFLLQFEFINTTHFDILWWKCLLPKEVEVWY